MMKRLHTMQAAATLLSLLSLAAFAAPAAAEGAPQKTTQTVTWYADHQRERAQKQLACMDDPGHLAHDPDCINAQQASVEVALRQARSHTGTLNPNDPSFWSADPNTRAAKLSMCRLNPQLMFCDVAKRSLLIEAGQAKR